MSQIMVCITFIQTGTVCFPPSGQTLSEVTTLDLNRQVSPLPYILGGKRHTGRKRNSKKRRRRKRRRCRKRRKQVRSRSGNRRRGRREKKKKGGRTRGTGEVITAGERRRTE